MIEALFPDPREADPDGLVGVGNDLSERTLIAAYSRGIFPWPAPGLRVIPWVSPDPRAVLELDRLHLPRSLRQQDKKARFTYTFDAAFPRVIAACAKVPRPGQSSTWITAEMERAYLRLHERGLAHSSEAWDGDRLVGGVYGVSIGGVFAGESMFHEAPHASKLALLRLLERLRERGASFMDIQMLTPHMEALGAREVPRSEYLDRLAAEQARGLKLF